MKKNMELKSVQSDCVMGNTEHKDYNDIQETLQAVDELQASSLLACHVAMVTWAAVLSIRCELIIWSLFVKSDWRRMLEW